MGHAATLVIGALILYVLHFQLGISFGTMLLVGMTFAALSGYIGKRRSRH